MSHEEYKEWLSGIRDGFKSNGEKSNLDAFRGKRNLNLGCGVQPEPTYHGWINADINRRSSANVIFDMRKDWPIKDESFDMIFGCRVFNMFFPGEEIFNVFAECWRALKPGGYLVGMVDEHIGNPFQKMIWSEVTPLLMTKSVYYDTGLITSSWDQGMPVKDWQYIGMSKGELLLFVLRRPLL